MRRYRFGIPAAAVCLTAVLLGSSAASAQTPPSSDKWIFRLTPYVWLPSVDGEATFELPPGFDGEGGFPIGPDDYLPKLDFAFMGALEARRGSWSILFDGLYLDLGTDNSSVTVPILPGGPGIPFESDTNLQGFVGNLTVGRMLSPGPGATLDLFGGIRWFTLEASANIRAVDPLPPTLPGRHVFAEVDGVDGIIGARGRLRLGERWYAPYHLDVGTGASELSWQAILGAAYSLNWGDIMLVYRHLSIEPDRERIEDLSLSGPTIGVGFRL